MYFYSSEDILAVLMQQENAAQRQVLTRFFKCGKGEYGEGDRFLGLKVPQTRAIVKMARLRVAPEEIEKLHSPWHEVRLCGFLLLVEEMKHAIPGKRKDPTEGAEQRGKIAEFYLRHARKANNWDLVDLSCPHIIGQWLLYPQADGQLPSSQILDRLAASDNLWEQRIAIVSTLALIRADRFDAAHIAPTAQSSARFDTQSHRLDAPRAWQARFRPAAHLPCRPLLRPAAHHPPLRHRALHPFRTPLLAPQKALILL